MLPDPSAPGCRRRAASSVPIQPGHVLPVRLTARVRPRSMPLRLGAGMARAEAGQCAVPAAPAGNLACGGGGWQGEEPYAVGERGGGRWSCLRSSSSRIVTEGMWRLVLQSRRAVLKYGLAVVVVSMGLAVALLLDHYNFIGVADPLFLFSIALTVWFAGPGPG